MKYIFGIAGKKQAGKDSIGGFIRNYINEEFKKESKHISFALPMKFAAKELLKEIYGCEITDEYFYNGSKKEEPLYDRFKNPIMIYDPNLLPEKKLIHASARILYQVIGTQFGRMTLNESIWVQNRWDHIEHIWNKEYDYFTITDFRFPNEIELIKKNAENAIDNFKFIMIRVNRSESDKASPDTHASETSLDNYRFECIFENDGTLGGLEVKVINFLDRIFMGVHSSSQ